MKESSVALYDQSSMRKLLTGFPDQIEHAVRIGKAARVPYAAKNIRSIATPRLRWSSIASSVRTWSK